jgi:tetratricopeptide (TPR) repeat protein
MLDHNHTTQHLRELRAIKGLLAIIAVSLLMMSVAVVIWVIFFIKTYQPCQEVRPVVQVQPFEPESQPYVIEKPPDEPTPSYPETQPDDFPAKASELLDQEKYPELIVLAEEQRNVNPDNPYIHHYLGMVYYRTKDFKKAVGYLKKADELSPNDPYRCYYLGMAYYHTKEFVNAIEYLTKAQELSPSWKEKYTGPYIRAAKEALDSQIISPQETP